MKSITQQVVTANRLADGRVVYLTPDGGWSDALADARVAEGKDDANGLLAVAEQAAAAQVVVAPYLIDVVGDNGSFRPVRFRERIRANGPPVQSDLSRQPTRKPTLYVPLR